ncbi:MAG: HAD family hydrolase [Candidatus Hermodarchaeota archaeon]|nr:HAD family hydrolase [Candidatus Hermodarchaeota archaeon]
MVLQLVVFDLDGTLVTAEIDFHAMRQAIRDLLISNGFPLEVLPMNSTQDLLRSAFAYAQSQGNSPVEISELRDKVYAVAVEIEWEGAKKAQLVLGARETLQELRNRGVNVAVLTNDNREVADFLLAKFEMDALVDLLVSRDEAPHMKPSTEGLELILKHFGVTSSQTIFIGDSTIDIMTAKKLRIPCIARLSKVRTEKELHEEGAIEVFPTLEPVIQYLDEQGWLPLPTENTKTKG